MSLIAKGKQINKLELFSSGKYCVLNGGINPSGYTNLFNTPGDTISISEGGHSYGFVAYNKEAFWSGGHNYTLLNVTVDKKYLYQYLKNKKIYYVSPRWFWTSEYTKI